LTEGRSAHTDPLEILPERLPSSTPDHAGNIYADLLAKKRTTNQDYADFLAQLKTIFNNRLFDFPVDTSNRRIAELFASIARDNARACEQDVVARADIIRAMTFAPTISIIRAHAVSFPFKPAPISDLYDENGFAHVWTSYVIARGSSVADAGGTSTREHKAPAPLILARGETIKDRICAKCGVLASDTSKLDSRVVSRAITHNEVVNDFYKFYYSRCPEGGEHMFFEHPGTATATTTGTKSCKKCSMPRDRKPSYDATTHVDAYFAKYVATFREYLEGPLAMSKTRTNDSFFEPTPVSDRTPDAALEIARARIGVPWTHNYEIVMACIDAFKITNMRFRSIGAREGLTDAELADVSYVAPVPKSSDDPRLFTLRNVILELFSMYRLLRAIPSHTKIRANATAYAIDNVRKEMNMSSANFDQACSELPTIDIVLRESYPNIAENLIERVIIHTLDLFIPAARRPRDIADFYLETFATVLLALSKHSKLCAAFARIFLANVDARENMTMKSGYFNISVIEGTKLMEARENNAGVDVDADDDGDGEVAETYIREDGDEEDTDPFSLDSFDVEDGEDGEEGTGAEMHMGRDIGW
jgi:hypothetical protein